jgi:two-component system NtrC family sensor kinase
LKGKGAELRESAQESFQGSFVQESAIKTIKAKITVFFVLCLSFTGFLTALYYQNIFALEKKFYLVERFDDLLNDILELRRYEKNFIYSRDLESLNESIFYFFRIEDASGRFADSVKDVVGPKAYDTFREDLSRYKHILEKNTDLIKRGAGDIDVVGIREAGKSLVDFAQNLMSLKRLRIQKALSRTLTIPLAFLGTFAVLVVLIFQLITRSILKPLALVHKATEQVANETFERIHYRVKAKDEVSELIAAFNKMAEEIKSGQEQLLQSRKMASIGTFTSGIAHELNNPLNNISITAESLLLESSDLSSAEANEMIQDILNQADRASQVVKNLLEFSRTERPFLTDLNVKEVIDGTLKLVKNQIMVTGITLKEEIAENLPAIRGKRQDLQQALLNIILNSIQAMPKGGTVTVRAHKSQEGYIRVDVEDTGCGIKPKDMEHIFDPFYTTKPVGEGTGLGLSLTYSIIRTHGGYIEVKSDVDKGTAFSIYLPSADGKKEWETGNF